MNITIIGGGYVGLVSAAGLAAFGSSVTIVEHDATRLSALQNSNIPIYEPGLEELFKHHLEHGSLNITNDLHAALKTCEVVFIAVGTPTRRGSGHADLSYVYAVAHDIARLASHDLLVVTKSTVPIGTGYEISRILNENRNDLKFHVASNPEFLREGNAIKDFIEPDRVVIGLDKRDPDFTQKARTLFTELYQPITTPHNRLMFMDLESAELAKYAANAFLAMKVTFANEMADLCETTNADITDVVRAMGKDPRIGEQFLNPGPGYGGSCFPKDTRALATSARKAGAPTQLVETTIAVNDARKLRLTERILALLGHDICSKKIAVLGLTFKANTDDMREAPSLTILPLLNEAGAKLQVFDPQGFKQARPLLPKNIHYAKSPFDAVKGADAILILTEWPIFNTLTPQEIKLAMPGRLIIDYRDIWDRDVWQKAGFTFHRLGYKTQEFLT